MTTPRAVEARLADRRVGWLWLLAGTAQLLVLLAHYYPVVSLARVLSPDGNLSEAFAGYFRRSQQMLCVAWLVASPLAFGASRCSAFVDRLSARLSDRVWWILCGALAGLLTWTVQGGLFQHMPHVTDAISHHFQAQLFCLGRLWAPVPLCHEAFFQHNLIMTASGRWFTAYPPGHALGLALAMRLGLLHWHGPALSAATVVSCGYIAGVAFGRATGRAVGLLLSLSPLFLLLGASFMSHTTALATLAGGMALTVAATRAQRRLWSAAAFAGAGFLFGWAAISRPQDAALLAPVILLGALLAWRFVRPVLGRAVCWGLIGLVPPVLLQAGWSRAIYGSALALGYGRTGLDVITPLLVPVFGLGPAFTLHDAVRQLVWTLFRFDQAMLGWPAGIALALTFVALWKADRRDVLCWVAFAGTAALYFAYRYYGQEYEARFYEPALPFCIVLVVRGLRRAGLWLSMRLDGDAAGDAETAARGAVLLLAAVCTAHGALNYWPRYVLPRYGRGYEQVSGDLHDLVRAAQPERALILIPTSVDHEFSYGSGFFWNDPLLTGDVIYARDLGASTRACLAGAFPGRRWMRWMPSAGDVGGRLEALEAGAGAEGREPAD